MTSSEVIEALRTLHPWGAYSAADWIFVPELMIGTGYGGTARRIDAWAMHTWPSRKFERVAYEVKVSRGDFLRELKQPEKREAAMEVSNRFYFAAPRKLISPFELPNDTGLVEVLPDGTAVVVREAPWRDTPELGMSFLAAVARRMLLQVGKQVALVEVS